MEHGGQLLSRDLVHVGDHQQQTLGGGVGAGEGACAQRAVDGTGGAGLRLHLDNLDLGAEDVLQAIGRPLVNQVGHGAGRSDRVDRSNFGKRIGDMRGRVVAVHGLELSCHKLLLLNI